MAKLVIYAKIVFGYLQGVIRIVELAIFSGSRSSISPDASVIISLTSFPGRINGIWITIESILQQKAKIRKIVLVLSTKEFPSRKLPASITRRLSRGLEVIWISEDIKSFKKLIPIHIFPGVPIITIDDDMIYDNLCISQLLSFANSHPGSIIGHRGYSVQYSTEHVIGPYRSWKSISSVTEGRNVFLTGCGSIYYPPDIFDSSAMLNFIRRGFRECPTADDVWMWAYARHANITKICTGLSLYINSPSQILSPRLWTKNRGESGNDIYIKKFLN